MALEELRAELAKVKSNNDRLLIALKDKLNAIMQLDKGGDIKNLLSTQLARFDSRKTGIRLFFAASGEDFFKARIKNEEDFAGFAAAFNTILEDLEDGIRSRSLSHDNRTALLNRIKTMSDAWIETKNERWTTELNESQLKTQLLALFEQTKKNIESLGKYARHLVDEDTTDIRARASEIYEKIEGYQRMLGAGYIADTQENFELVSSVRDTISLVREDIAGFATDIRMEMTLEGLDEQMAKVVGAKSAGKKLNPKKDVIEPFTTITPEALKKEEVDELGCAIYMIQQLGMARETFAKVKSIFAPELTMQKTPMPTLPNFATDPNCLAFDGNIAQLKEQGAAAMAAGEIETALSIKQMLDELVADKETYKAGAMEGYREAMKTWREQNRVSANKNPYATIISMFEKTYAVFSGKSLVSYKTRAKIMADQEVYDMNDLFQRYIDASMKGDRTTLINIRGLLKTVITEYSAVRTHQGLEADPAIAEILEMERQLDELDKQPGPKVGEKKQLTPEEQAKLAEAFGTPVTAGTAPKVNTEPEAPKVNLDDLMRAFS